MANVVNVTEVKKTFIALGWDNLSTAEVGEWLKKSGVDPAEFLRFCRDVLAAPDGLDPSTDSGLKPADVPYVEEFLRGNGVIY